MVIHPNARLLLALTLRTYTYALALTAEHTIQQPVRSLLKDCTEHPGQMRPELGWGLTLGLTFRWCTSREASLHILEWAAHVIMFWHVLTQGECWLTLHMLTHCGKSVTNCFISKNMLPQCVMFCSRQGCNALVHVVISNDMDSIIIWPKQRDLLPQTASEVTLSHCRMFGCALMCWHWLNQ